MALNLFGRNKSRGKDKSGSPAETQAEETEQADPNAASDDQANREPLDFQEVEAGEASEADLPQGLAPDGEDEGTESGSFGQAATATVQRRKTRGASGGTPAKGRRASRGKARTRTASRARPARKRAPAKKTNQRSKKASGRKR